MDILDWRIYVVENTAMLFNIFWTTDEEELKKRYEWIRASNGRLNLIFPYPKGLKISNEEMELVKNCITEVLEKGSPKRCVFSDGEMLEYTFTDEAFTKLKEYIEKFGDDCSYRYWF